MDFHEIGDTLSAPRGVENDRAYVAAAVTELSGITEQWLLVALAQSELPLRAYILALTGEADIAEDLFQQTSIRALRWPTTFDRRGPFVAWLRAIARNLFQGHIRAITTYERVLRDYAEADAEDRGELASCGGDPTDLREAMEDALTSAVLALPPRQRAMVIAFYYERQRVLDIARRFGVRPGTVMAALSNGRRSIRASLASQGFAMLV